MALIKGKSGTAGQSPFAALGVAPSVPARACPGKGLNALDFVRLRNGMSVNLPAAYLLTPGEGTDN
jgi:hypothetical protein